MAISYEPHVTRGQKIKPNSAFPSYQRAFDSSWWNRGVGKTMRNGDQCAKEAISASRWMKALLLETPKSAANERAAIRQRFAAKKKRLLRRAHVYWRRGHRTRRAQWLTQDPSLVSSAAMLYHYLMQKHHERVFARLSCS